MYYKTFEKELPDGIVAQFTIKKETRGGKSFYMAYVINKDLITEKNELGILITNDGVTPIKPFQNYENLKLQIIEKYGENGEIIEE